MTHDTIRAAFLLSLCAGLLTPAQWADGRNQHAADLPEVPYGAAYRPVLCRGCPRGRFHQRLGAGGDGHHGRPAARRLVSAAALDEPIKYRYFDLWHYAGRTAKHGAFMGGADFVQWHGFYEIVARLAEIKHTAADLRDQQARHPHGPVKPEPKAAPTAPARDGSR